MEHFEHIPTSNNPRPEISVIMPTYKQANFIVRALDSLFSQTFRNWELVVVNDGSPDDTEQKIEPYLADTRIRYLSVPHNVGLGRALNLGLAQAKGKLVAYLPSDDVYYSNHLHTLHQLLAENPQAILAFSGVRHHYNKYAEGTIAGYPLQLVQVMHRAVDQTWMERSELVTDDLDAMFWSSLRDRGRFVGTGQVTCEWVEHPRQRHKIIQDPVGGINTFRVYYQVQQPLRFKSTTGSLVDEVKLYADDRARPDTPMSPDGLKILLVGELAYNADRVLALEETGHKLYGLWTGTPNWFNTVGPLPFGHVQDLDRENWLAEIERIQPDVIYALLNWQAVPFVHSVLKKNPGIPFVWHFKEGPFICLEKGMWDELVDLYVNADGVIYVSREMQEWFATVLPTSARQKPTLIMDGDPPRKKWFGDDRQDKLSKKDGQIHTVVPGRPIGLHPPTVAELAVHKIHLHFYGEFIHEQWREWIEKTMRMAPGFLHLHSNVDASEWVYEFSQYDAGWLHFFKSGTQGEIRRANWDDLNIPARTYTLIAAGLPLIQYDNQGFPVASQSLARNNDLGIFARDMEELSHQLHDSDLMARLSKNVWEHRLDFTFDAHVPELVQLFRQVIQQKRKRQP